MPYNYAVKKGTLKQTKDHVHLDHTAVCDITVKKKEYMNSMQVMTWVCMYVQVILRKFCACMSLMQLMLEFKICSNCY